MKTAVGEYGMRVFGIEDSFEGLLGEPRLRELTPEHVRGLLPRGGTILGTRNRGRFSRQEDGDRSRRPAEPQWPVTDGALGRRTAAVAGEPGGVAGAWRLHQHRPVQRDAHVAGDGPGGRDLKKLDLAAAVDARLGLAPPRAVAVGFDLFWKCLQHFPEIAPISLTNLGQPCLIKATCSYF